MSLSQENFELLLVEANEDQIKICLGVNEKCKIILMMINFF